MRKSARVGRERLNRVDAIRGTAFAKNLALELMVVDRGHRHAMAKCAMRGALEQNGLRATARTNFKEACGLFGRHGQLRHGLRALVGHEQLASLEQRSHVGAAQRTSLLHAIATLHVFRRLEQRTGLVKSLFDLLEIALHGIHGDKHRSIGVAGMLESGRLRRVFSS